MTVTLNPPVHVTVAVTGASGAVFAREMLKTLEADARVDTVNLIVSDGGMRVLAEELELTGRSELAKQLLGATPKKTRQQNNDDIGANVASGSYPTHAMVVIPCSMGTLARIANGLAIHLVERAADVCLKQQRPLILCVRETPLNRIHLRNMQYAAEAGSTIFPLIPTFYNKPVDSAEMARQFVFRVLEFIGLPQPGTFHWKAQ